MFRSDPSLISTMQIASETRCVIFDCFALRESESFQDFVSKMIADPKIEKIAHTFQSDIKVLKATFKREFEANSILNLDVFCKKNSNILGLARIAKEEYGKTFSKYNQESAWSQRPLRRSQIHYAALDAVVCVELIKKFRKHFEPLDVRCFF